MTMLKKKIDSFIIVFSYIKTIATDTVDCIFINNKHRSFSFTLRRIKKTIIFKSAIILQHNSIDIIYAFKICISPYCVNDENKTYRESFC